MTAKFRITSGFRDQATNDKIASRPVPNSPHWQSVPRTANSIAMYRPISRRIKGAGREGRQYEAAVSEGRLTYEGLAATLPDGSQLFCETEVLPEAMAAANRAGWLLDRAAAESEAEIQAARRDSEPVRRLRKLAMGAGHGGNGLHKMLDVPFESVAAWRTGRAEIPAEIAAKIAALLQ